jgi:exosortase
MNQKSSELTRWSEVWWQAVIIIALIIWLYSAVLARLIDQWWKDPNYSHGFFVPVFSLLVVWRQRAQLLSLATKPSQWGLLIVALGLGVLVIGVLGDELFLSRASLLLLIAGLIVFFLGWSHFRTSLFAWAFLLLMIPLPAIVFNQVTFPMQILSSKLAASVLPWLGVPVLREGNIINLPSMPLEVAEACSGIRSLLSLVALVIAYGYAIRSRGWIRVALVVIAVPVAIIANSLRIVGTGLAVNYWDLNVAHGFFHSFSGWVVFVFTLGTLLLLHQVLASVDFKQWRSSDRPS